MYSTKKWKAEMAQNRNKKGELSEKIERSPDKRHK